jgi:predicted nucleic acid-binding protein
MGRRAFHGKWAKAAQNPAPRDLQVNYLLDYDLLIAGQALRREFTLVTANVTEFARVKGLAWQDWSKQS